MPEMTPEETSPSTSESTSEEATSRILNQLLESTLAQRTRTLSKEEWDTLSEVAKSFEGSQATFDEFVLALVRSFLLNRFPATVSNAEYLKNMSHSIGQSLCNDPLSRQRLVDFHQQLLGLNCGS